MRSWLPRIVSLCILLAATMAWSPAANAGTTPDGVEFQCGRNEAGDLHCWYVDENGDPWEPPPPPPEPASLDLGSDERKVFNAGSQCYGEYYSDPCEYFSNHETPGAAFADFDGRAWAFETGATQSSHARPKELHFEGNVYAGGDAELYGAWSYSRFDIPFEVDDDVQFELEWLLPSGLPEGEFFVSEDGTRIFEWDYGTEAEDQRLIDLLRGREYRLYFYLDSHQVWGYEGVDYSVTFSQFPEPGTASLIGVGLAALGWRRRKPGLRVSPTH